MTLIQKSGVYTKVLNDWPPALDDSYDSAEEGLMVKWAERMFSLGDKWQAIAADSSKPAPQFIQKRWRVLKDAFSQTTESLRDNRTLAHCLLELAAIADEASAGAGLPIVNTGTGGSASFFRRTRRQLIPNQRGSTLCIEIDPSRARVLPKMHAPSKGLTVRSLSHHLALCSGDEICPVWEAPITYAKSAQESMNLLVVPWPETIRPVQFEALQRGETPMRNMPSSFGFFRFRHTIDTATDAERDAEALVQHVRSLYDEARSLLGRIDGIVFPELALVPHQFERLREVTKRSFFVGGIAGTPSAEGDFCRNDVYLDVPIHQRIEQSKHHRWKLDSSQIGQYGLGSRLSPQQSWWEFIDVSNRKLNFVSLLPWLVMSVVICEDLARPDPVGDLLRSVGPNLVIALLMDGPQIKERWSARYATTLAEDPGCSVLSVTSIGMSKLSRPASGANRSRVIGLWKDAQSSTPVEIDLPEGCSGVVLSLSVSWIAEWTADGRKDRGVTGYPLLSGIHPIRAAASVPAQGVKSVP